MVTEKRLNFVYILLIAAALYNFAFATWVVADPAAVKALVLRCHFKHGYTDFPIEELKAGTSVRFSPHGLTPTPMEETGLFEGIEVPHLEGYFDVRFGEITLVPGPNGGTTLRATTEYVHRIGPSQYWTLWSGAIIDKLHMAVLRAIVEPAERSERAE